MAAARAAEAVRPRVAGAKEKESTQPDYRFDKVEVYKTVMSLKDPKRLGAGFYTKADLLAWTNWLKDTPATLADVLPEHSQLPLQMPMKCLPAADSQRHFAERTQQEFITYKNPAGRSFSILQREREANARAPLFEEDVDIGDTVALTPTAGTDFDADGSRTPFWLGDVARIDLEGSAVSSSEATSAPARRAVTGLVVHYRVPLRRKSFCDDVSKPWKLACWGLHDWDTACEGRGVCKRAMLAATTDAAQAELLPAGAGTSTTRMLFYVEAGAVFQTKIKFTGGTGALSAASKRLLAESGPVDGSWEQLLHISTADSPPREKAARGRVRGRVGSARGRSRGRL